MAIVVLFWVLNFAISICNAFAVGRGWVETKHTGGWVRLMAWMGAIMSASGFTWCYTLLAALGAHSGGWLDEKHVMLLIQLGYVLIIPGVLVSGMAIMLDSWATAYRTRSLPDMGIAAWNTYAQIHNAYSAYESFGDAFGAISEAFKGGSSDDDDDVAAGLILVVVLAAVCLFAGVLTTAAIIKYSAGRSELAMR